MESIPAIYKFEYLPPPSGVSGGSNIKILLLEDGVAITFLREGSDGSQVRTTR
jgi:hypothetical protein